MTASAKTDWIEPKILIPELATPPRACPQAVRVDVSGQAFATTWSLRVCIDPEANPMPPGAVQAQIKMRCEAYLAEIDRLFSPYRLESDLTRFNEAKPWGFVPLPPVFMDLARRAVEMAQLSDGAFDPCLLPAVELWGFGAKVVPDGLPPEADLTALRSNPYGWRDLVPDSDGMIRPEGVKLDLCGIAKGYAVDGLIEIIQTQVGCHSGLAEIGGELKGWGVRPDGSPWWVEVEKTPLEVRTLIALCDVAVATSGNGRRAFEYQGRTYSHTIDAKTHAPTQSNIMSATVLDPHAWRADALATALMAMGEDAALTFADTHAIPCLLRLEGGRERLSPALEAWL
jgi:FAD:protein FMN transferase